MQIHLKQSGHWAGNLGSVRFGATTTLTSLLSKGLSLRYLNQVHGNQVVNDLSFSHCSQVGDGLVSGNSDVALAIRTADCIPLHLWDHESVGMIHAGWRSTKQDIVLKSIQEFKICQASAIIGPSISKAHYEVDSDLYDPWLEAWPSLSRFLSTPKQNSSKRLLDLRALVAWQLMAAGIPKERIHTIPTCTFTSPLPSYRREGRSAGRIINYIYRQAS